MVRGDGAAACSRIALRLAAVSRRPRGPRTTVQAPRARGVFLPAPGRSISDVRRRVPSAPDRGLGGTPEHHVEFGEAAHDAVGLVDRRDVDRFRRATRSAASVNSKPLNPAPKTTTRMTDSGLVNCRRARSGTRQFRVMPDRARPAGCISRVSEAEGRFGCRAWVLSSRRRFAWPRRRIPNRR